jgi:hypothetical protein
MFVVNRSGVRSAERSDVTEASGEGDDIGADELR